jgi:two-component system chemotaxis response regulator CheY
VSGERILVVDDDDSIRQIVSLFLEDEGFRVVTVPNGQAALDVVATYQPDIILLDLRMPVMDGYEFVRRYRSGPPPHAAIVAFIAALKAEQERERIGAASLLEKPFDLEELLTAVNEARKVSARTIPLQANT